MILSTVVYDSVSPRLLASRSRARPCRPPTFCEAASATSRSVTGASSVMGQTLPVVVSLVLAATADRLTSNPPILPDDLRLSRGCLTTGGHARHASLVNEPRRQQDVRAGTTKDPELEGGVHAHQGPGDHP